MGLEGKIIANLADVPLHLNALMIFAWENFDEFSDNHKFTNVSPPPTCFPIYYGELIHS